jgi:hypothetical protein
MGFHKHPTGRGNGVRGSSVGVTHDLPQRASDRDTEMLDAGTGTTSESDKACCLPTTISQSTPTSATAPMQVPAIASQGHRTNKANTADASVRRGEGGEAHQSTLAVLARTLASDRKRELQLKEYKHCLAQTKIELHEQKKSHEDALKQRLNERDIEWEYYLEKRLHEEEHRHQVRLEKEKNDVKQRYEEDISRLEAERRAVERESEERLSSLEKEKRKVREHAMSIRTLQEHALKNVESAQWMSESDTEIVRQLDRILEDVKKWSKKWSRSAATGEGLDLELNQCLDLLPGESLAIEGVLRERVSFERKIPMWLIISAAVSRVAFDLIIGDAFFAFQDADAEPSTSIYSKDIGYALKNTLRSLHSRKSIDVLLLQSRPFETDIR